MTRFHRHIDINNKDLWERWEARRKEVSIQKGFKDTEISNPALLDYLLTLWQQ